MNHEMNRDKRTAAGVCSSRPYPCHALKPQLRDPRDGPSAFAVLRETFFPRKPKGA